MSSAEIITAWLGTSLYAVVSVALLVMLAFRRGERLEKVALWAGTAAVPLHLASLVLRGLDSGHLPVLGNYENASAAALFITAPAMAVAWRSPRLRLAALAAVPLALFALGWGNLQREEAGPLGPAFQSTWLVIHVVFANLSYGAYSLATGAGIAWLVRARRERLGKPLGVLERLPDLEGLDDATFRFIVLGFLASALMIVAGSFWADALWGSYWSWDPVETWSLVSWLTYGLYIHLRVIHGWRGRKMAWIAVGAIVFVLISFWGVNLFQSSAHRFMAM